jgi:hypothetical protein
MHRYLQFTWTCWPMPMSQTGSLCKGGSRPPRNLMFLRVPLITPHDLTGWTEPTIDHQFNSWSRYSYSCLPWLSYTIHTILAYYLDLDCIVHYTTKEHRGIVRSKKYESSDLVDIIIINLRVGNHIGIEWGTLPSISSLILHFTIPSCIHTIDTSTTRYDLLDCTIKQHIRSVYWLSQWPLAYNTDRPSPTSHYLRSIRFYAITQPGLDLKQEGR